MTRRIDRGLSTTGQASGWVSLIAAVAAVANLRDHPMWSLVLALVAGIAFAIAYAEARQH